MDIRTHNGTVTLKNPATGNHRTFQIRTQPDDSKFAPGQRIVALMDGPDNVNSYRPFGFISESGWINLWRKHRESKTFQTYAHMLRDPNHWEENHSIEYLHEGRCRICNRKLTTPDSVESGIGPVCAARG